MAFNPERLSLIVQPIGDGGIRFFGYQTDDAEGTLVAADYFARGRDSGMRASDLIFISPKDGATDPYILVIDSVDDEGNATAVLGDSLALGGYASESEATGGIVSNKTMSPLRAKQLVDYERTQDRSFTGVQTFYSTSEAATSARVEAENTGLNPGPLFDLLRTSASPAANDYIGGVRFRGIDSAAAEVTYGNVRAQILDPTTTATDSLIEITTAIAGAQVTVAKFYNGMIVGAPTGSYQGTGTVNATGYYLNGTALSSTLFGVAVGSASGNLNVLNADGGFTFETAAPTINFMPAGLFGGAYDTSHLISSTDTATAYTGMRSTQVVRRIVTGTGGNNPNSDHALMALITKDNLDSTTLGEIGAIRGWAFQNAWGDSSAMLLGSYKKIGDGSAAEGGMTSIEVSARRFTTDISTITHLMNCITGFSPNPTSTWGGRNLIGFYSENHAGGGFANFLGITDGAEAGTGTMDYLLAGFRQRDIAARYFSVDYRGFIDSIWNDAGATGIEWTRRRDSASPAASDILARDVFVGKNASATDIEYVSAYAAIVDTTAGSEDGQWTLRTFVAGAAADQITVKNGVAIGAATSSTQGTGTLNLAGALLINANTVIDANRHLRLRSYTVATLPTATPAGQMIYVSDGTANKRLAVSDATNWRFPDGNIVS